MTKPLFTAAEIRRIAGSNPQNLPVIRVLKNDRWSRDPMADDTGRVWMNETQFDALRKALPVKELGRVNDIATDFVIAFEAHHLEGGRGDRAPARDKRSRQEVVREITGQPKPPKEVY